MKSDTLHSPEWKYMCFVMEYSKLLRKTPDAATRRKIMHDYGVRHGEDAKLKLRSDIIAYREIVKDIEP